MSRTNDISKLRIEDVEAFTLDLGAAATFTVRELRDDELQSVNGGMTYGKIEMTYTTARERGNT